MRRTLAALTIVAVSLLGATACSASPASTSAPSPSIAAPTPTTAPVEPAAPAQTVEEACALLDGTMTAATGSMGDPGADPDAAVEAMHAVASALDSLTPKITNPEVAALLPTLGALFSKLSALMDDVVAGDVSKLGELSDLEDEMQDMMTKLQSVCHLE